MSFSRIMLGVATLAAGAVGCDDPLALPPAAVPNVVDTLTLFALQGTPIDVPSGYNVVLRQPARTDRASEPFDFAFNIDSVGRAQIFTTGALRLSPHSAIQISGRSFDDIDVAPIDDYDQDSSITVAPATVFVVRSRSTSLGCPFYIGQLPRYGKFRVLAVDTTAVRSISLQALVNVNCGYRGLEIGLPKQ